MAYKKLKYWFDRELGLLLAQKLQVVFSSFDSTSFVKEVEITVEGLELKARVERIADALHLYLGKGYSQNCACLMDILGPENEEETGMFTNFYWVMPIAKYIEKYGLNEFDLSMKAIKEITKRNTGEYTIRPYIEQNQEQTMAILLKWSKDENKHVRRLASEGSRPRLPWAKKLQCFIDNPNPLLPILNNLKDDTSRYVQKSVANCINDILKDNPPVAIQLIENWTVNATKERQWIIKHALRNLRKKNDAWALKIVNQL